MGLTREEIIAYATRYIAAADIGDFPMDGDLFCLFSRTTDSNGGTARETQWEFQGYGVCQGYRLDQAAKPAGKWLWFEYLSLTTFPPHLISMRLQPPHVVTGTFHAEDRTREMRVVKVPVTVDRAAKAAEGGPDTGKGTAGSEQSLPPNVLRFPGPRSGKPPSRTIGP